eukprot:g26296.t1
MLSDVPLSLTPTEGGKGLLNLAGDAIKVCVRVRPLSTLEPIHSRARARVVERWGVVIVWDWTGLGGEGYLFQLRSENQQRICVRIPPEPESPHTTRVMMLNPNDFSHSRNFSFDRAFWSVKPTDNHFASQEKIMQDLGAELREHVMDGYNSCLIAYGQTGSGKTYTILGHETPEQAGLLPRISEESPRRDGWVRAHPKFGNFVHGVKEVPVMDWPNMKAWLDFGVKARAVASTSMNATSSRSHCIFSMEIVHKIWNSGAKTQQRSKLNVVDLAGSERQKKSQTSGSRLKEGETWPRRKAMINQSLSNLALVISRLADLAKNIHKERCSMMKNEEWTGSVEPLPDRSPSNLGAGCLLKKLTFRPHWPAVSPFADSICRDTERRSRVQCVQADLSRE